MDLWNAVIAGTVVGGVYALLAVGLSLIFATTGVLNIAHAGFAMVAAYMYAWLGTEKGWSPTWAAVVAILFVTSLGAVVERLVIRRVAESSPTTKLISTLGVLSLMQGLLLQFFGFSPKAARSLLPNESINIGSVGVTYQQITIFVSAVGLMLILTGFLRFTRTGLAVRAVAQDQTVAQLMGMRRTQIAMLNWSVAAFLAAVAGVLIAPLTVVTIGTFPIFLLKALGATLFGGVSGILGSFLGGFAIGNVEAIASTASSVPGIRELVVLIVVLALLLLRRNWPADVLAAEAPGGGALGFQFSTAARLILAGFTVWALVLALTVSFWSYIGGLALVYILVGLSLVVLTGWTGQVSLMHGGLTGLGAFGLTWYLNRFDFPMPLAIFAASCTGMVVGGLFALPALRLRGLQLGIATLAVGGALSEWLFQFEGTSWTIARPDYFVEDRNLFLVMLPVTLVVVLLVHNLRKGAWGRMFFAVRQSSDTAAHFGISPLRVRVSAFLISGFLASMAGAFYALLLTAIKPADFGVFLSISFLLYVVVGGSESLAGPLIAGLLFAFGPQVVKVSQSSASALPDVISGLLVLLLVAGRPAGLASFLGRAPKADTEATPRRALIPRIVPAVMHGRLPRSFSGNGYANGAPNANGSARRVPAPVAAGPSAGDDTAEFADPSSKGNSSSRRTRSQGPRLRKKEDSS